MRDGLAMINITLAYAFFPTQKASSVLVGLVGTSSLNFTVAFSIVSRLLDGNF